MHICIVANLLHWQEFPGSTPFVGCSGVRCAQNGVKRSLHTNSGGWVPFNIKLSALLDYAMYAARVAEIIEVLVPPFGVISSRGAVRMRFSRKETCN